MCNAMMTLIYIPELFGISIAGYFIMLVIAIPIFFFWRWLLKKIIKADRIRIIATWLTTLILTPLIYVALIGLFFSILIHEPSKDFDKSQWFADKEERYQMADDIINNKMLNGKDTTQLKQIIGDPTSRGDSTQKWTYDLGMGGGGLGFMFHYLIISFDKDRVVSVEHKRIRD